MNAKRFARWIASCGGLGFISRAPGTLASVAALAACYVSGCVFEAHVLLGIGLLSSAVGMWGVHSLSLRPTDDPAWVVIDEWCAQWLLCAFVPHHVLIYVCSFLLFRLLDIFKPWPVSVAEKYPGVVGIFADDLVAAFLAGIFLSCTVIPSIL